MAIQQSTNEGLRELALFAGAGGGILGGKLLGWRTVCAVERDAYAAQILAQRQNDGILEAFPIWSDVCSFNGSSWRGIVDVVSGGFPCQDISAAGKGAGIEGERSGMWKEMARIIGEVRPKYAFVENSPMLTTRGLGVVLADLAALGFDAEWGVLSAADVGAPHERERIWIVARQREFFSHTKYDRDGWGKQLTQGSEKEVGEISNSRREHGKSWNARKLASDKTEWAVSSISNKSSIKGFNWFNWQAEPDVLRMVNGMAHTVDRLKAIGNGQVPLCAATAFELLRERLEA